MGEAEKALKGATTNDIIDLAGVLGLHSMMNQEQYHSAQSDKWAPRPDPSTGWSGVTKATPLKEYPAEEPNRTDPEEIIQKMKSGGLKKANLNNVPISDEKLLNLFEVLKSNDSLTELSMGNTSLSDFPAANLAAALESNTTLLKLNIESNNVSPQCLVKIFEAANVHQVLTEIKASNQMAQFLGNKVEMAITKAIENNKTLLKVGLHFDFGDCRNRVAVQLQKNLDRIRLRRLAENLSKAAAEAEAARKAAASSMSRTSGFLGGLPGQLPARQVRQKSETPASEAESEDPSSYEYYDDEEEEEDES